MGYIAPSLSLQPSGRANQILTVNDLSTNQVEIVVGSLNTVPPGGVERVVLTPQETNALITALISAASAISVALTGTVSVTLNSASITFSQAQTLPAGTMVVFGSQPGVVYFLASAVNAGTSGTLTSPYGGTTNAATTTSAY